MNSNNGLRSTGGLEIVFGQNSYRQYMHSLRDKKQTLEGIKRDIDHITGKWSRLFSLVGKGDKADLRQLVNQEITVLGDMSSLLHNLTMLYGGEHERLFKYFDLLDHRMENAEGYKSAELVPIAQPTDARSLIKSIKAQVHNGYQTLMGERRAVIERQTQHYAENAVTLMRQSQQAYGVLVMVDDQIQYAYEHLQATGPALVSLIEMNEAHRVIGTSLGNIKSINDQMYTTVHDGYLQLTDFLHQHRVPLLNQETKRIDFLDCKI